MTKTNKIWIAVVGGSVVGGVGVCGIIWPNYAVLCAAASTLITMAVAMLTGISITTKG